MFALRALARKHGVAVDALAEIRDKLSEKLADLEGRGSGNAKLKQAAQAAREKFVAAAQTDAPVIRVTTRLVDVSVVARSAKGAVADLKADDFMVFDNGVERKIAFFSVQSVTTAPRPAASSRLLR